MTAKYTGILAPMLDDNRNVKECLAVGKLDLRVYYYKRF
jgi:hypothetical protein